MAQGTDGSFASAAPWVLTSASINFATYGVQPNNVVQLTAPKQNFPGGGQFLAIDSVSANSITLRRPYQDLNVGQPPAPATGLNSVAFTIATFMPQINEAAYELKQRFAIDDMTGGDYARSTAWIYDTQVFRVPSVYLVLLERYTQEQRAERGDFAIKANRFRSKLSEAIDRIQVRFGPYGNSSESASIFSTKIAR